MKTFIYTVKLTIHLLCVSFLFTRCAKEVTNEPPAEHNASVAISSSACKPVVLGVAHQRILPGEAPAWATAMQKWYGSNGKVAFLKASLLHDSPWDNQQPMLPWGEVTYHNNNQVYVKNVFRNDTICRITLDEQQRPAASYFFFDNTIGGPDIIDTSYYYFTGSRLDSAISIGTNPFSLTAMMFQKHKFFYDTYGNLIKVENRLSEISVFTLYLNYDYSQPVANMLPSYIITRPFRLLEYLELLDFPVHHKLIDVSATPFPLFFTFFPNPLEFTDYQLLQNGLVFSYSNPSQNLGKWTYYTAWDCGSSAMTDATNRKNNSINSLEDFHRVFSQSQIVR